ncbi:MAG: cation-translocating P-type ATPase [Planctomycetes bacterium]|nr:cation-translocating P-type ATPase [Planctomycetota bacterium]
MSVPQIHCDFCGLPIPGSLARQPASCAPAPAPVAAAGQAHHEAMVSTESLQAEPQFCCFGCQFAAAVTREKGDAGAIRWTLMRLGLAIFFSMNVMAFSMALWTVDVYGEEPTGALSSPLFGLFRYLCLLFSFPVLILLGEPLLDSAWAALRRGWLSTDLLLLTGTVAAFALSTVSVCRERGPIYFEVACVILVMVTLGRWFEASGRLRAGAALDELQKLLPETVRVIREGLDVNVPAGEVRRGDRIRLLPGERFPTDGVLEVGRASVDQQILTGESLPVLRGTGESVYAGTLNLDGALVVEVTSDPGGGSLDRLIAAVRAARETRGYYQELADRISGWVFPAVAVVALGTFLWHTAQSGFDHGLTSALAVVLVSCPCALGLATPLAAWTALGAAARRQVLFRSGQALERLAGIRAVRFDKTGTLTTGQVQVISCLTDERLDSPNGFQLLARVEALTRRSLHPFSRAVREFVVSRWAGLPLPAMHVAPSLGQIARDTAGEYELTATHEPISGIQQLCGRGMVGQVASGTVAETVYLGSRLLMDEAHLKIPKVLENTVTAGEVRGHSLVCVGWQGKVRAVFLLEEALRESTVATISECRRLGLDVGVLTGDHQGRARRLSLELGVPVACELLPEQKLAEIKTVQATHGAVAMVGDGVNDAPALAASDVGVALGCGADVSRDAAAVCLLSDDPARLVWAIGFARDAVRVMRRNLYWAFAYNCVGVALAASGHLNPALAALLMVVSSVLVVRSSLSLQAVVDETKSNALVSPVAEPTMLAPTESAGAAVPSLNAELSTLTSHGGTGGQRALSLAPLHPLPPSRGAE